MALLNSKRIVSAFYSVVIFSLFCFAKLWSTEIKPVEIALGEEVSLSNAEISGLDWYKDKLVLLPQYPDRFSSESNGCLFYINKSELQDYLFNNQKEIINPHKLILYDQNIKSKIDGFQGYEAIAFSDNTVYLTIEAEVNDLMQGYVIKGQIDEKNQKITLNPKSLRMLKMPVNLKNMAYESLLIINDRLIAIYEANGKNINPDPFVISFDLNLKDQQILSFPKIEYRVTDATRANINGEFWMINYLFEGEFDLLKPENNNLESYQESIPKNNYIEQVIKCGFKDGQFEIVQEEQINIQLDIQGSRNWEGIARLDSNGLLIITDYYPATILAYLPVSNISQKKKMNLHIYTKNDKYGFADENNQIVIQAQFNQAYDFNRFDLAAVVDDSGWVYINSNGERIIRPHVVDNGPDYFVEGLARFVKNKKFGFFDESGKIRIKAKYDYARSFSDGLAAVCNGCQFQKEGEYIKITGGKWGFINTDGEIIHPLIYDQAKDFINGTAEVILNGKVVLLKKK